VVNINDIEPQGNAGTAQKIKLYFKHRIDRYGEAYTELVGTSVTGSERIPAPEVSADALPFEADSSCDIPLPMGMLEMMFERQKELMHKYHDIAKDNGTLMDGSIPVDINSHKGQAQLKATNSYCVEELFEAMNCLKNKAWKQCMMETDIDHYQEELVDALHFFIELLIQSGFTPEKLFDIYFKKSEVNKFRQRSNY
jgi:hypothetical protein